MYQNILRPLSHVTSSTARIGGICTLLMARWEDVATWPEIAPDTSTLDTAITLKSGKTWYLCYSSDPERNYTEDQKPSSAGPYISHRILAQIPGDNGDNTLAFKAAQFHRFVLVVKDKAGLLRLVGNQDAGAELVQKYDSGTRENSRKRSLEFTWDHSLSAPLLTAQTFIIDGIEVNDVCAVSFPPGDNPVLIGGGGGGGSAVLNEQINLTATSTYELTWNSTRQAKFGVVGVFQVFIKDPSSGKYIATNVEIKPDSGTAPTKYDFDFGGPADVLIVIT